MINNNLLATPLQNYTFTYPLPVDIPGLKTYHHQTPFLLEAGGELPELTIAYHTYGKLNERGDNVVWVCHALTANSDVLDWWPGLFGSDTRFDPKDYFIVCANILRKRVKPMVSIFLLLPFATGCRHMTCFENIWVLKRFIC